MGELQHLPDITTWQLAQIGAGRYQNGRRVLRWIQ